ncbi:MAG: citrate synthase [Aigarchaeota archaeon]|nr:citrate synthase [Aigarchaeota archaeon]MCX8193326.1 citrate synthase [Nitrososphaeria archaeon]MDW7986545.1 citrate/2-methylcitrate synthase [Nitrososphaerota archaeon]
MGKKLSLEDQPWCIDKATGKLVINKGVENVCIDKSTICYIDGFHSKLYYRGYSIEELAQKSTYEEVVYLLLYDKLPNKRELTDFSGWMSEERDIPREIDELLCRMPRDVEPMEVLRTATSYLGNLDPGRHDTSRDGMFRKTIRLVAKIPTIIAHWHRIRNNQPVVDPDPRLAHAENFLYMMHCEKPDQLSAKAMDVSFILLAEHEMNASAFTAVVIASTLSDYYSAIVGAIGALRGPLHGYANVAAMRQFEEIGSPDNVEKWYKENILTGKKRVMGAGHRVYKTYDPRAKIFRDYARQFADKVGGKVKDFYEIASKLEDFVMRELCEARNICTNCDFWSGIVYYAMNIPIDLYCTLFVASRTIGWSAHILEYIADNRIIRPRLYYDGEIDKEYIPIEKR